MQVIFQSRNSEYSDESIYWLLAVLKFPVALVNPNLTPYVPFILNSTMKSPVKPVLATYLPVFTVELLDENVVLSVDGVTVNAEPFVKFVFFVADAPLS